MNRKINYTILALLLLAFHTHEVISQSNADTVKLVNEYSKVMAFSLQPYLYYHISTKMSSLPVFSEQDTATLEGEYFKNQQDVYSNNGQEELFIQDSFLIRINQQRKTILINKVNIASKKTMDVSPFDNRQLEQLFIKKFTITKSILKDSISRFDFVAKQQVGNNAASTSVVLEYNTKNNLPAMMEVKARMQQPLDDDILLQLQREHISEDKLVQVIEGKSYLVRTQQIHVAYSNISNAKEAVTKMPRWNSILDFDTASKEFTAKGVYKEYEITTTF